MMLNAWYLPVPPFVKQSKDQLLITLWLTGEAHRSALCCVQNTTTKKRQ